MKNWHIMVRRPRGAGVEWKPLLDTYRDEAVTWPSRQGAEEAAEIQARGQCVVVPVNQIEERP